MLDDRTGFKRHHLEERDEDGEEMQLELRKE